MDFDGKPRDIGSSIADLLQRVAGLRSRLTPPADPIAQLQTVLWQDARLPKGGGLFGAGYARYMADLGALVGSPDITLPTEAIPRGAWPPVSLGGDERGGPDRSPVSPAPSAVTPMNSTAVLSAQSPRPSVDDAGPVIRQRNISAEAQSAPAVEFGLDPNLFGQTNGPLQESSTSAVLDRGLAGPKDGAEFIEVGNPSTPRLRREWERAEGQDWPRDPATGRRHDVAHVRALADGGTDTLDNIRPLARAEHIAQHMADGDFSRFAKRRWIASAFGSRVGEVLGPLGILPDITGVLSGRIRTNSIDNFISDMFGLPSQEDRLKAFEDQQRAINPNWKRGDPVVLRL
jgi:hypothetical protein